MIGPNMKKLIVRKLTQGLDLGDGSIDSTVAAMLKLLRGDMVGAVQAATNWARDSIELVKSLPDNPYGDDEEAIAGQILAEADKKRRKS